MSGVGTSGRPPCGLQDSPIAARTRSATPTRSFAIAAGVSLFELARFMGTSVEQIDRTYGHLLPDSIDRTRASMNTFLAAQAQAREEAGG